MSLSMLRRLFIGREASPGAGGTPDRELIIDAQVTPTRQLVEVNNRHDASRAAVAERVVGSKGSTISIPAQPLQIELLPVLLSMCLAGGQGQNRVIQTEYADPVTDGSASAGTVANPTNPNSVARYTFRPLVSQNPNVNSYSLFAIGDGVTPQQIRFLNMDTMTIAIEPSGAATMAASLRGHYPDDYSTSYQSPSPVRKVGYALGNAWTVTVDSSAVALSILNATLTIPSGIVEGSYIDGGQEANTLNPARRTISLQMTVIANASGQSLLSKLRALTKSTVRLVYTGDRLREAPVLNRSIDFTLHGQFTNEGVYLGEEDGQAMYDLTFETLADDNGHDIEAVIVAASDDQTDALITI